MPTLYLIPVPVSEDPQLTTLPQATLLVMKELNYFVVENAKVARKHLKGLNLEKPISSLLISELSQDTDEKELELMLSPLSQSHSIGLMSDAGCPAVADPGAKLVALAQKKNITVVPLVGPSSIILSLMASGLNGQRFCFSGYLPVKEDEKRQQLQLMEKRSKQHSETQIFIETPYRNQVMFNTLLSVLHVETLLTVSFNVTAKGQTTQTKTIRQWRLTPMVLEKSPAIYLFLAQ
ncbi:MAG: SAM-dependent methyltransferase [Ferrovum sp. 37-45-19]|uniref:SAM-dependent methyltransferase n=1 Tax=Ferrovum sp. JA12 TaxID=1356299 RepID=UPI0007035CFA|nr:SAM-dependent methyltransferase [Ferrovum sp. JA12]OYV80333.1 MAG: SAM-dependent methyltransferase [Ferrovum sp. 21-44-67]OYV95127.1 MAG: SAM-dependent methyltransferase [Ferrovum sp. 37-45-19]HQT80860.1 SAM-dependent methyltransferase [Ferrovaceae bacterium]